MDFTEYIKIKKHICDNMYNCNNCPFSDNGKEQCQTYEMSHPQEAEQIVLDWKKYNMKTYKDILLEKLPNCDFNYNNMCVRRLFGEDANHLCDVEYDDYASCDKCWEQIEESTF